MNKKLLLFTLIIGQIIVIICIIYKIQSKKNILGSQSVSPVSSEDFTIKKSGELTHYYEPQADSIINYKPLWLDYIPNLTINKDTLNERYNYSVVKSEGTYRIITLGDSFTYGLYINTQNNWTELLEDKLNSQLSCTDITHFEVINLGVPGYDLRYMQERYASRGQKYQSDLIIYLLNDDDLTTIKNYFLPIEKKIIDQYRAKHEFKGVLPDNIYFELRRKATSIFDQRYTYNQILEYQLANFLKITKFNIPLAVTSLGSLNTSYKDRISKILKESSNKTFYRPISDISNSTTFTFLPHDGHPNNTGHQIIAEDTFNFIHKEILTNCRQK